MIYSSSSLTAEINRQTALAAQIAQLQTDVSSGVRVHVASDDPAAAARISSLARTQAAQATYASNISVATSIAGQVDSSLSNVTTALTRVNELMLQASNGTMNESDRAAAATELQGLRTTIASYASAKDSNGNALYSTSTPLQIPIGEGQTIAANSSYDDVFGSVTTSDGSTKSIDDILGETITALQTTDDTARAAAVKTSLSDITSASDHINIATTDIGLRESRLNSASDILDTAKTNTTIERTGLEETNQTEALSTLSAKMTALSAAQSVLAQLSKISLFDKLT